MFSRLAFVAALLTAPMAAAQTPPPATVAQVAEARKLADEIISAGRAEAWFENITDGAVPKVRHAPSGMTCMFAGNRHDRIAVFPTQNDGVPQGSDVGCVWYSETTATHYTLYATRYSSQPSAEAVLAESARAIIDRYPEAQLYEGTISIASIEGEVEPIAAAYVIDTTAGRRLTLAMVAHRGEWSFKIRATGPVEDATSVSMVTGMSLVASLLDLVGKPATN
ncbi:hypothetical protein JIP62_13245 [Brevundimonas vitis]|uniref:Uncharacterized protein n=1 Tax=Brevundimonas vitisensis TaxID=2800818 RepID=A0ABX7BL27_9CAUL|nr:hypothetical protein [Brevundimonas vitisensis]QQQ18251.1 hypothetical protein JIP62_13245 [Brevundimonas vitisensis]